MLDALVTKFELQFGAQNLDQYCLNFLDWTHFWPTLSRKKMIDDKDCSHKAFSMRMALFLNALDAHKAWL